ncbi:MAG: hypothetical protein H6727_07325 [Myxococcales bacterium]|nr:hypothetical protein [Myxococcales bacterium]
MISFSFCRSLLLSFLIVSLLPLGRQAHAQDQTEFPTARRIYVEGMRFYNAKRYREASIQLALAFNLITQDPKLSPERKERARQRLRYFLGKSYIKSDQHEKAQPLLEDYIRLGSTTPSLKGPEERVKEVQDMLALARKVIASRPKKPKKPKTGALRPAPFIVLGLGVTAVIVGGVMGFLASNTATSRDARYQEIAPEGQFNLNEPPNAKEINTLHSQADTYAITANILYIAGGVVAATGIILAITIGRAPPTVPAPSKKAGATVLYASPWLNHRPLSQP